MNRWLASLTLATFGLMGSTSVFAQSSSATGQVTVTGCLSQGTSANEYMLRESSGKTYNLSSSTTDLKAHVGHEITVTGTTAGSAGAGSATQQHESSTGSAKGGESLTVSDVKMVSTTCKQ